MKITEFIKKELSGWQPFEIIGLAVVLVMILTNKKSIRDVILFPAMRPLKTDLKENK